MSCSWLGRDPSCKLVLRNISAHVVSGELLSIVGPVGSGKSTLLLTLLGELLPVAGSLEINGTLVYASQEPWVFSGTVRANIIFSQPFEELWYSQVVEACQLTTDISSFDNGSDSEIGERGITLSGGEWRVTSLLVSTLLTYVY